MLKQCLILFLLSVGPLSAEAVATRQEPVKKILSYRQEIVLCKVVFVSNCVMGCILSKPLFNRLFSKNIGIATKALWVLALVGVAETLAKVEEIFFERYPYLLGPSEESETKQENISC